MQNSERWGGVKSERDLHDGRVKVRELLQMSMITMEDGEDKLCDPDAFAACYGQVEGSLPAYL